MKKMRTTFILKPLALYLVFACFLIAIIPANSWAYLVEPKDIGYSREADMNNIQRVLESKMVSQRLSELGLSSDAINTRINQLSDADIHQFASQLDSLMPGGQLEIIITLLVIAILVLVILQMTGHKVVVK
ncbi:MAG: PA2779 family protein [Deltaproteobacteria bacterium]|nr:PA2779 family protein [Deltaproteobacteria bacterium]